MFKLFYRMHHRSWGWLWPTVITIVILTFAITGYADDNSVNMHSIAESQTEIRAYLTPRTQTTLSTQIDAQIQRLAVKEGEAFKKESTLVVFDCMTLKAQHNKARAVLQAATDKNKVMQRLATLHSIGTLEADASRSEQNQAAADLKLQESRLRGCQIKAPFSGRVAKLMVANHQYISTGQPLMKIIDHRHLEMEMIVPSRWLTWLKPQSPFSMYIEETGTKYLAHLIRLGAEADPVSQSIKVVGELEGDYTDLLPGMSGTARFTPPTAEPDTPPTLAPITSPEPTKASGAKKTD